MIDENNPFSPNYKSRLVDTESDKRARPWHVRRAMGKKVPTAASPSISERDFKQKPADEHPFRKAARVEVDGAKEKKPDRWTTPWYSATALPARVGVYERKSESLGVVYTYWDGEKWFAGSHSPDQALFWYGQKSVSLVQRSPWRGLAKEPK